MKKVLGIYGSSNRRWVGDGFQVRSLLSHNILGRHISPFFLLDYAGPTEFTASSQRRGGGEYPCRGGEAVTIVYEGELEHRDSTGGHALIGAGDVQWMTSAVGVIHEDDHSMGFMRKGGTLEVVRLWINLSIEQKMIALRYQLLRRADVPVLELPGAAGQIRIIAGQYAGHSGAVKTVTPVQIWDLRLRAGKRLTVHLHSGFTCAVVLLDGVVRLNGVDTLREAHLALLDPQGSDLLLEASRDSKVLLLSGEPLHEPM
ncbi:pirin family protein [Pseudomonas brenneri]|uniref:pirin family protein n=1 Tax=Pseudomonas brenneri TaxID=129817 RepID=UPI0028D45138|nr:pirin family protein [Pseudomonas brenneri]